MHHCKACECVTNPLSDTLTTHVLAQIEDSTRTSDRRLFVENTKLAARMQRFLSIRSDFTNTYLMLRHVELAARLLIILLDTLFE